MRKDGIRKKLKKAEVALVLSTLLATKPKPVAANSDRQYVEFNVERWGNPDFVDDLYYALCDLDDGVKDYLRDKNLNVVILEGEDSADALLVQNGFYTSSNSIMGYTDTYDDHSVIYVEGVNYDGYYEKYSDSSKGLDKSEFNFKIVRATLLHEIGHFLDDGAYCSLSGTNEFNDIFNNEFQNFTLTNDFNVEYFKIYANINTPSEYFATAFSCYASYPDDLQAHCPATYQFIDSFVNQLNAYYGYNNSNNIYR